MSTSYFKVPRHPPIPNTDRQWETDVEGPGGGSGVMCVATSKGQAEAWFNQRRGYAARCQAGLSLRP